ncbi:hypothetical protein HWV62_45587 [Athelia sp. TMB]|nr:hypothetical protein HWV62_45587 [Athelia sp. TMB]
MGAAVSVIPVVLTVVTTLIHVAHFFRGKEATENPFFEAMRREEKRRAEAEKAAREAQENAKRYRQESRQEKQRADESDRRARSAQDEADKVKAQAKEMVKRAEAQQETAEEAGRIAHKDAHRARQLGEDAGRQWREGIQPEIWPTLDELSITKKRLGYIEGLYHFAVVGIAGGGKSSLINALRGVTNGSSSAALTGSTETTKTITGYPDPDPSLPFVWHDVPGAGTLSIPGWLYFHQQGLYIFDCIIVLFDNRFTAIDIAILQNCARFKIPAYIVRSKSDQNLANVLKDVRRTYQKDKLGKTELRKRAKEIFTRETRENVERELKRAQPELPSQRVYMVSQDVLCHLRIANGLGNPVDDDSLEGMIEEDELLANIVDEGELIRDILTDARDRRPPRQKAEFADNGVMARVGICGPGSKVQSAAGYP